MIEAIIIDDEPYCCETLEMMIARFCPQLHVAGVFQSGEAALKKLPGICPQLVFLDIEMPHMNGFEFLEKATPIEFGLIFTTSYDQYAIKAIRFSAMDYLLKPIDREELTRAVLKATQNLRHPSEVQLQLLLQKLTNPKSEIRRIAIPTVEGLQMIEMDKIISGASESNYTHLFLKDNKRLTASKTMKDVEELLGDHGFIRVHNSFLVNLNEIHKYIRGEGGYLIMSDGSHIDVSRARKEMLLQKTSAEQDFDRSPAQFSLPTKSHFRNLLISAR